ncbi:ComEC/Rec2 family competence protein [Cyclobacterium qasimii]|nr:ComEC/Rec2 family competence protein [Cyclobacterium qasimii]
MKFNEFPFIRYTVFFVLGVLLYPLTKEFLSALLLPGLLFCLGAYFILAIVYSPERKWFFQVSLPVLAYLSLIFSGMFVASSRDVDLMPEHLVHFPKIKNYLAEVQEADQIKPNSKGNLVFVYAIENSEGWKPASGQVQIYHQSSKPLLPGTTILIKGAPQLIPTPTNPSMFDYSTYMERKGVYFTHFIGEKFSVLSTPQKASWSSTVIAWRQYLADKIGTYIENPHAVQISTALLLGQKNDMDTNLKDAYATAGAMHILAVSGLHVGIIYGFFFLIFKPSQKKGFKRVFYLSLIMVIIWFYAILTGLSPSVLRSATMFTFICFAQMKSRSPSIFNPLALSALVLLLYDPFLIYAVGFQLSYAALMGILLFQPLIRKLWHPEKKWLRYLWDITSVGLAAQLTTFPLAVYYFHIFPTYFILTNLLAIPAAFVIMSIGVPFLLFAAIPYLASILGWLMEMAIRLLNYGIFGLQALPFAKMDNLYLYLPEMILFWSFLFFLFHWIDGRKKYQLTAMIVLVFAFGIYRLYVGIERVSKDYLIIYNLKKGGVFDYLHKGQLFAMESEVDAAELKYSITPHRIKEMGMPVNRLAFSEETGNYKIALPGRRDVLLDKKTFLPVDLSGIELLFWKDGKWWRKEEFPLQGAISEGAIKITFNNKESPL